MLVHLEDHLCVTRIHSPLSFRSSRGFLLISVITTTCMPIRSLMITAKDFHSFLLICLWLLVMLSPMCTSGAACSRALLKLVFIPCSFVLGRSLHVIMSMSACLSLSYGYLPQFVEPRRISTYPFSPFCPLEVSVSCRVVSPIIPRWNRDHMSRR